MTSTIRRSTRLLLLALVGALAACHFHGHGHGFRHCVPVRHCR